jgi:hypothetical protein
MKFKSAEADWNISFVSQQVEGRNWSVRRCGSCIDGLGSRVGNVSRSLGAGEDVMKAYIKYAASFWMNAFLTIGLMATASRSIARTKKNSVASSAPVPL